MSEAERLAADVLEVAETLRRAADVLARMTHADVERQSGVVLSELALGGLQLVTMRRRAERALKAMEREHAGMLVTLARVGDGDLGLGMRDGERSELE